MKKILAIILVGFLLFSMISLVSAHPIKHPPKNPHVKVIYVHHPPLEVVHHNWFKRFLIRLHALDDSD